MHPRLTASNGRVALDTLKGRVQADRFDAGEMKSVVSPVADLRRAPKGGLDSQLLYGQDFLVLEQQDGYAFGQAQDDGYCGYVRGDQLAEGASPSHWVCAFASHVYFEPNLKSGARHWLPFGAKLAVTGSKDGFLAVPGGFVPVQHLSPLPASVPDFVTVIESFLGVPYLWGGNSPLGVDCSGIVQLALRAAGRACPRDTDMQQSRLGRILATDASRQRGDLVFWDGHVGVLVDKQTLIHANAHHMAVATEPFAIATARIAENGGGQITSIKRL